MSDVAVIVGGSDNVWAELEKARALCADAEVTAGFFIVNDMIAVFPEPAVAVTLHVYEQKLGRWLSARQEKKLPAPTQVWAHQPRAHVTNISADWGGSVGLFATKIAIHDLGFKKVLLCGVPMTAGANHFIRKSPWVICETFKKKWVQRLPEIKPLVRSFDGWTAEQLGQPSAEWLRN